MRGTPKTCARTTITKSALHAGFTLIEILLVLALLGLLAGSVIPKATNMLRVNVHSSVRHFGSMVRYAYDQSILTGKLHRIVLDMDNQSWGVEAAEAGELPVDKALRDMNPYLKERAANREFSIDKKDKDKDPDDPSFSKVGGGLLTPMPKEVRIVSVKSWRLGKDAAKKGTISIYAYPTGLIDEATVTLAEAGNASAQQYQVSIKSLTGQVEVQVEKGTP